MLYTRKGDAGTTKVFNSKPGQRISKSSCQTESLGALDELNSFLGLAKVKAESADWQVLNKKPQEIIHWVQNCLFIIQAEVAGSDKRMETGKVTEMEKYIDTIEADMPPIKTFFISGGSELAALFDITRTLARKAERRAVAAKEQKEIEISEAALSFLNRLSSLLYAFARYVNHRLALQEQAPWYN